MVSHVNASNIDSGTLSDLRLSGNVALLNATSNTFTGAMAVNGDVIVGGVLNLGKQDLIIADNGLGTPATTTLTPTKSYVRVNCVDSDGCGVTLGEGGAVEGDTLVILNDGSGNPVTITDSPGVSELAGNFVGGSLDTLSLIYDGNAWVETARSNN